MSAVRFTDKKTNAYARVIKPPRGVRVRAGILEREGSKLHSAADRKTAKDEKFFGESSTEKDTSKALTVAALGTIHEFGLGVPERSFIRAWFDNNQESIIAKLRERFREAAIGRITYEQASNQFALWVQGSIQANFPNLPALAQSTIDRKGSSVPLVDTSVLKSAVTAKAEVNE